MNDEDIDLIKAGTKALTEALGAEKAAAFLALVNPGDAVGAIEPPPTAPVKPITVEAWIEANGDAALDDYMKAPK